MRRFVLLLAALALAVTAAPAIAAAPTVNDPLYAQQWGPQQVRAPEAWATSTGAGQVIAIVDSGVDLSHPDLAGKFVTGATFAGCPKASCGNGDWTTGKDAGAPDPHGTHVAGIAAAVTGNGTGIAGVAPDAKIMPVKVLGEEGGTFEEIAAGIRWATDNGADVINMSLGAWIPGVQVLEITGIERQARDAIAYANSRGVVVVVAAGNESSPLCASPSFNNGALCVGATDRFEAHAYYSNLTVKPDLLAVSAPGGQGTVFCGEDIISTVPVGAEEYCRGNAGYDSYAGTSMATPHVAGVAALLTAQGRSNTNVYDVLTTTARQPVTGLRGIYDPVYGYGIVDAAAAVAAPGATVTSGSEPTTESSEGDTKGNNGKGNGGGGGKKSTGA